jgi:hypothetical protein
MEPKWGMNFAVSAALRAALTAKFILQTSNTHVSMILVSFKEIIEDEWSHHVCVHPG